MIALLLSKLNCGFTLICLDFDGKFTFCEMELLLGNESRLWSESLFLVYWFCGFFLQLSLEPQEFTFLFPVSSYY